MLQLNGIIEEINSTNLSFKHLLEVELQLHVEEGEEEAVDRLDARWIILAKGLKRPRKSMPNGSRSKQRGRRRS